jgi:hypothetical protein
VTSGPTLTMPYEMSAVHWYGCPIPGLGCQTIEEMREVWRLHGDRILPHYVDQRPGTRPFALYALGILPMPPIRNHRRDRATTRVFGDRVFYDRTTHFGELIDGWLWLSDAQELEFLREHGIVDDEEHELAETWIRGDYRDAPRYRLLSLPSAD